MPVAAAVPRCEELLADASADPLTEAAAANALGYLEAMRGRFEEARGHVARNAAILEEFGLLVETAVQSAWNGQVEMLAGRPETAEQLWRSAYEALAAMGERGNLSTIAAFLADAVLEQGRDAEAESLAASSERAAAPDDVTTHVAWRAVRSRARARAGDHALAEQLAREAVELAATADWPNLRGSALSALAEVLLAAGEPDGKIYALEALEVYEAKGNAVAADRVRALLERMPVTTG